MNVNWKDGKVIFKTGDQKAEIIFQDSEGKHYIFITMKNGGIGIKWGK